MVFISRCFGVVLRVLGGQLGEFNWEKGNLCGMGGFGWRRRESGKKLNVMSGYEWCEWCELEVASERMRLEGYGTRGLVNWTNGTEFCHLAGV